MEHATKCRNRTRVALSSIFHPLGTPGMQRSLSQRQRDAQGQEERPTFVLLFPLLIYHHKGTGNMSLCL